MHHTASRTAYVGVVEKPLCLRFFPPSGRLMSAIRLLSNGNVEKDIPVIWRAGTLSRCPWRSFHPKLPELGTFGFGSRNLCQPHTPKPNFLKVGTQIWSNPTGPVVVFEYRISIEHFFVMPENRPPLQHQICIIRPCVGPKMTFWVGVRDSIWRTIFVLGCEASNYWNCGLLIRKNVLERCLAQSYCVKLNRCPGFHLRTIFVVGREASNCWKSGRCLAQS